MPTDPCQSEFIYGLHDPGGESIMEQAGVKGWILFTEAIGADPNNRDGRDYSSYCARGFGVISRLNNGYHPGGTIPNSSQYAAFAQRCANVVQNSRGCRVWIIGNEMNFSIEWPGGAGGQAITPTLYADCYRRCREAIRRVAPDHQVLVGAVAPWNVETKYPGNPSGSWVQYFSDVMLALGPQNCDGFTLHTYTHGDDPALITSDGRMDPPFQKFRYHFAAYQDFLGAVPANMRHLPCYITETDQGDIAWTDVNRGWIQRAYDEINRWNSQPGNQVIRALILYRWPQVPGDRWGIDGKMNVIADFKAALPKRYTWPDKLQPKVPDYVARFLAHGVPATLAANTVISAQVRVRNDGSKTWLKTGANPVRLGYHWLNGQGQPVSVPAGDFRSELPANIEPGKDAALTVKIGVPAQPGSYTLRLDMVEEGVTWFRDQGSTPLSLGVDVKPAEVTVDKQFFDETKHWVGGPFLAWHRRYGLDVTGYPITDEYVDTTTGLRSQYFQRVAMELFQDSIRLKLAGQDAVQLREQVSQLQTRINILEDKLRDCGGGRLPPPAIADITATLPRDPAGLVARPRGDITKIVINHTAVPPTVGADRVAEAHRKRWPGIVYQYFITGTGEIQQTAPLEQAVTRDAWIYEGVHIGIAGNFATTIPTDAQLDATAALAAWLLQELSLPLAAVVGASEVTKTASPGAQWLTGQRYKNLLVGKIQTLQASGGPVGTHDDDLRAQLRQLQTDLAAKQQQIEQLTAQVTSLQNDLQVRQNQIDELTGEIVDLRAENDALRPEVDKLRSDVGTLRTQNDSLRTESAGLRTQMDNLRGETATLRTQVESLRQENQALRNRLGGTGGTSGGQVPAPAITDIADQLPRDAAGMKPRDTSLIQYLVFNHTAVDPTVSVQRVAEAHRKRWPGITYHYYIQAEGNILQTNPLDQSVTDQQEWLYRGIQICLAGNFATAVPTAAQLDAAAHLAAWLLQHFQLPIERIKGASELTATGSPGVQWLQGAAYKRTLVAQTQSILDQAAPSDDLTALRAQIAQLNDTLQQTRSDLRVAQTQLTEAQQRAARLQTDVEQRQAQITALQQDKKRLQEQIDALLAGQGGVKPPGPIDKPPFDIVTDQLPKSTVAGNVYKTRALAGITQLVIHHSAAPAGVDAQRLAQYQVTTRGWPGIGCHFLVAADGGIAQTNRLETVVYHTSGQDASSVGIMFAGDFADMPPTPLQLDRGAHLVAWLAQELKIPNSRIVGHDELPGQQTSCPGEQWLAGQQWKRLLFERIQARQGGVSTAPAKFIEHYLLFWSRGPDLWAEPDYRGAIKYVARFTPVIGFSLNEAKTARFVTIVGGPGGVPANTEEELQAAGVRVERIAGKDYVETQRLLDELAAAGRRFRSDELANAT